MKKQEIEIVKIEDLHLWTENPRDPIKVDIDDLDIIKRAIKNEGDKWNLPKLIQKMGGYYHFNKLPIVVKENGKYIVYDGNCRVAILKYLQNPQWSGEIEGSLFPKNEPIELKNLNEIPCAVCQREIALDIIYKDNISNNTWTPLIQSYFEHYLLGMKKSLFLSFEEITGLISSHEKLNQRFVKDEIITEKNLESIGFKISKDKLLFSGSEKDAENILKSLIILIEDGVIKTRNDKEKGTVRVNNGELGNILKELLPENKSKIKKFNENKEKEISEDNIEKINKKSESTLNNPPKDPVGLFFKKYIPYGLKNSSLKILYEELATISVKDFPNATHDLLRSFLECSLVQFLKDLEVYNEIQKNKEHTPKLSELITYVIKEKLIDDDSIIKNLEDIKKDWDKSYSISRMNAVNHNEKYASTEKDARATWAKLESFFLFILKSTK